VKACAQLDGVTAARVDGQGIELSAAGGAALLPRIVQEAERHAVRLTSLEVLRPDLESVFLALTGKELRD
jgi:ABC-2 type transport system ATP-binding protein